MWQRHELTISLSCCTHRSVCNNHITDAGGGLLVNMIASNSTLKELTYVVREQGLLAHSSLTQTSDG